jgi:hypothetical protein
LNKDVLSKYLENPLPFEHFEKHLDFEVKIKVFNLLFKTKYSTYQEIIDHTPINDPEVMRNHPGITIVSNELGRCLGYLHNSEYSKMKLSKQIDSSIGSEIGRSIYYDAPQF